VPNAIIVDFVRALGVESAGEDMDVDGGPRGAKGFEGIKKKVKELMREGYSASQILSQVGNLSHFKDISFTCFL
jgi:replication factor C subunit 2/4